ncbi:MAG: hypothetical protein M3Q99_10085 [Acidobacteriota bacterium]|nr:hypothetical protein [Acidobacteriota bacterium]
MSNNTTEKTEYQILREKLNDRNFAFEFFENKEIEAKRLLDELLSVATGSSVVKGTWNEWANQVFYRIFEIFTLRHENFESSQLAENLQHHLFTWSRTYADNMHE